MAQAQLDLTRFLVTDTLFSIANGTLSAHLVVIATLRETVDTNRNNGHIKVIPFLFLYVAVRHGEETNSAPKETEDRQRVSVLQYLHFTFW